MRERFTSSDNYCKWSGIKTYDVKYVISIDINFEQLHVLAIFYVTPLYVIFLQTEIDPDTTEPSDKLASVTLEWCKSIGSDAKVLGDLMDGKDQAVLKAIQAGIDKVNKKAESNAKESTEVVYPSAGFLYSWWRTRYTHKIYSVNVLRMYGRTVRGYILVHYQWVCQARTKLLFKKNM